jgi:hypothetical protein
MEGAGQPGAAVIEPGAAADVPGSAHAEYAAWMRMMVHQQGQQQHMQMWAYQQALLMAQRVCVYYCSTYYKAVRVGGGG